VNRKQQAESINISRRNTHPLRLALAQQGLFRTMKCDQRRNNLSSELGWAIPGFWESDVIECPQQVARRVIEVVLARRDAMKRYAMK
jgi:hypothetical protein